jgi:hydroxyethylthiazole kinase
MKGRSMSAAMPTLKEAIEAISALRRHGGRVHCLTNDVAQAFTANVLLACGAAPSMTSSPREVATFTAGAGALSVNLGTLQTERMEAIRIAVSAARQHNVPFVLDPVKADISPPRLAFARDILGGGPAILRVNASEVEALGAGRESQLAPCMAVTGEIDRIRTSEGTLTIANGTPLMDRVTAVGCAQGAVMAALLIHSETPAQAALAAILWFAIAGESAAGTAGGPGSFAANFIDRLYDLPLTSIEERASIR